MKNESTPGPWHAVDYCGFINIQSSAFYEEKNNLLDAEYFDNYEANGNMAAAAPDMHDALVDNLEILEQTLVFRKANGLTVGNVFLIASIVKTKAAIAKANPPREPKSISYEEAAALGDPTLIDPAPLEASLNTLDRLQQEYFPNN